MEARVRRLRLWPSPQRLLRVTSSETRAEAPVWPRAQTIRAAADARQFRAHAGGQRIARRFLHVVQDVFAIGFAVGILDRRVHLGEHAQVIQAPLRIGDRGRRERVARIDAAELRATSAGCVVFKTAG